MIQPILDLVEAHSTGVVMVRSILRKDGVDDEYIRQTLEPGQDVSSEPEEVQSLCAATWTPEVIAAWNEKLQLSFTPEEPLQ
jgi:hypothetical protein